MTTFALLSAAGPGTWRAFLEHWGASTEAHPTAEPAVAVPAQLREFHAVVPPMRMNHLVGLPALKARDGRVVIYAEEQGVYYWAIAEDALGDEDPPVIGSDDGPRAVWSVQAPALSLFLTQLVVVDAAFGDVSIGTADALTAAAAAEVLGRLQPLPWPAWAWPPDRTTFHAADGLVAVASESGHDEHWIWIGGRTPAELEALRPVAPADQWDWSGLRAP